MMFHFLLGLYSSRPIQYISVRFCIRLYFVEMIAICSKSDARFPLCSIHILIQYCRVIIVGYLIHRLYFYDCVCSFVY